MRGLVRDVEAEAADAPVDVELARAEDALALRVVEVRLVDVVAEPGGEVGGETQRALAVRETRRLVRERAVAREEVVDGGLDAAARE